ncbi:ABC transporter permease [Ruminococcus gauvreauii]|uniref:ABC transporter permease n=1 Tax=Ruminococcus gauvreauii TaxID=438033 RepID=A0ABY5VCJ1_9FIRM|nr:ABC transporter permease [Ruminococcus gauvreauii]UWP58229.1 ABC transporter permease [Ruminococcus gauvreauii]
MHKKKNNGMFRIVCRRMFRNKLATFGLIIFVIEVILAILAPYISAFPYDEMDLTAMYQSPNAVHWFGTDSMGRDMFSRILYGARFSLIIGIGAMLLCMLIGIVLGALTGYIGKLFDDILMRFLDIIQAIPSMLLMIVVAAAAGNSVPIIIAVIGISGSPAYVRLFRALVLKVRNQEYIEASRSINCNPVRIVVSHIIPNAISPMLVNLTLGVANSILAAASLSFIGLGVQAPNPEWGALLSAGRQNMMEYPYLVIFPGLAIMITVFALNIFGDSLRDALDPKLNN